MIFPGLRYRDLPQLQSWADVRGWMQGTGGVCPQTHAPADSPAVCCTTQAPHPGGLSGVPTGSSLVWPTQATGLRPAGGSCSRAEATCGFLQNTCRIRRSRSLAASRVVVFSESGLMKKRCLLCVFPLPPFHGLIMLRVGPNLNTSEYNEQACLINLKL